MQRGDKRRSVVDSRKKKGEMRLYAGLMEKVGSF